MSARRLKRRAAARPGIGIIHLGPGAFFRAFGAIYTAEAMAAKGGDWGIRAVSLRSAEMRDKLAAQDYAYTSVTLSPDGQQHQIIAVIEDILVAPEDPQAVLNAMADPAVKFVSMTVTEKGYCHNPANGELRVDDANIQHDLKNPDAPRTAVGFIVQALARRRAKGLPPFTVLSCDNLPDNGRLTRNVVLAFARQVDVDLANWIEAEGAFPATMVDRITPATTPENIAALEQETGYRDEGCVLHEPFRQWVIEDNFVGGERPAWEAAGAQLVDDVAGFETMKLRCLNGTHSALAYLGYLAGYETISQTVADADFDQFLARIWANEIVPTVPQPEGEDLQAYCAALKQRYQNPAIRHRTWQIAMDGSQKLPQRLLGTIKDNLAAGRAVPLLALVVAAWMRYVGDTDEKDAPIDVKDPMADTLRAASDAGDTPAQKVENLLALRDIFDADLADDPAFCSAVTSAYEILATRGAKAAIKDLS